MEKSDNSYIKKMQINFYYFMRNPKGIFNRLNEMLSLQEETDVIKKELK